MVDQALDSLSNIWRYVWRRVVYPPTVDPVAHLENTELTEKPYQSRSHRRRQNKSGNSAERTPRDTLESRLLLPTAELTQGLEGAHISGDHGKDGHSNPALEQDPDDRVLEDSRGFIFGGCRLEERLVESAADMCENDEKRCETTKSLRDTSVDTSESSKAVLAS